MSTKIIRLVIVFNEFYPDRGTQYLEVTYDSESASSTERVLKRQPTAARFDEVFETGEGSYDRWNAHKARKLYGHRLQKK